MAILRIALYKSVLDYTNPDFTYSSTTLYLFTSIDSSLGVTLACMPLLRPLGERLEKCSALTWVRSVTNTLRVPSRSASSARVGYRETGSSDGPRFESTASGGGYQTQSLESDTGIYVKRQFEQRTMHNYDHEMNRFGP